MELIPLFAGENLLESKTIFFTNKGGKSCFYGEKRYGCFSCKRRFTDLIIKELIFTEFRKTGFQGLYSFPEIKPQRAACPNLKAV